LRPLLIGISLLALISGLAPGAEAAPVNELETDGTASNNSLATAQAIPPSAFTLPLPPIVSDPPGFPTASLVGVAGGPDVDIYRISGHGTLLLDVDNGFDGLFSTFDTWLYIFNSSGVTLVEADDSSPIDPGTDSSHDSRILFNLPGPGVYFVAVSAFGNTIPGGTVDTAWSANGPQPIDDEDAGRYLLHLSLEHPHQFRVPVPLTLALLVCAGGLALGARLLGHRAA